MQWRLAAIFFLITSCGVADSPSSSVFPRVNVPIVTRLNSGVPAWVTHIGVNANTNYTEVDAVNGDERCYAVTADSNGNVYCAGTTSGDLNDTNGGGNDAFVMKFDPNGNLLWTTQLGNNANAASTEVDAVNGNEECRGVAVDGSGNVFCAGGTSSNLNDNFGGGSFDTFVMKLNSSGTIQWVTHIGTNANAAYTEVDDVSGTERCTSVALDSAGNVLCAGTTDRNLNDTGGGSTDVFIMKLNSSGVVQWVYHMGTNAAAGSTEIDAINGSESCNIAIDSGDNVICGGSTTSSLNDIIGGGADIFVMKLNSNGVFQWLTHFGTAADAASSQIDDISATDLCNDVAVDASDNIYCGGHTTGSFNDTNGGFIDTLIVKLNSSGVLQWSSQIGASALSSSTEVDDVASSEICSDISVDVEGGVYCAGRTNSNYNDTLGGGIDAFVIKVDSNGTPVWNTHFGANMNTSTSEVDDVAGSEQFNSVFVSSGGAVYVGGMTASNFNDTFGGSNDILVSKLN